jgi:two-component system response regulator NreC
VFTRPCCSPNLQRQTFEYGPIMRILIADDNELVRRGIARLLSVDKELEICGEASNSSETLQKADELVPDLILLDISMPGMNGLNTAQLLRQKLPALKILIISQHDSSQLLPRSLEAGAHGCIDKARIATDLLPALRKFFKN